MKNKNTMLLSTLLCLLPVLLGLALYEQLPARVPTHFDLAGNPDNYTAKPLAVFGLPVFMAAINLLCHWGLHRDQGAAKASPAVILGVISWLCPVLCNILMPVTLFTAMGMDVPISFIVTALSGLIFIIIGNYLPKIRPNRYMGIKLPWTFSSAENWRRTHRFGGFVWVISGFLQLVAGISSLDWLLITALVISILFPTVYSWHLSRKDI